MRLSLLCSALAFGLPIALGTARAGADGGSPLVVALCPVGESAAGVAAPCTAVHLLSARGYLVRPGTRIFVGVASERVNLMIRLAIF